jgi:hypothetical protein
MIMFGEPYQNESNGGDDNGLQIVNIGGELS